MSAETHASESSTDASTTVVVPLYNGEAYIGAAIDSVVRQTYPVQKIIVVDDGSVDGGAKLVRDRYPQVDLVRIANSGEAYARNYGLARATSMYVTFLDQDDVWHAEHLRILFDELDVTGATAIVPGQMSFGAPGSTVHSVDLVCEDGQGPDDWPTAFRSAPQIVTSTDLRSRALGNSALAPRVAWIAAGGFPVAVPGVGDYLALWNLATRSVLAHSAHRTVAYRVHPSNSTWSYDMGGRLLAVRSMLAGIDEELRGSVWDSGSIGYMVERPGRPARDALRLALGYALLLRPPLRPVVSEVIRGLRRRTDRRRT